MEATHRLDEVAALQAQVAALREERDKWEQTCAYWNHQAMDYANQRDYNNELLKIAEADVQRLTEALQTARKQMGAVNQWIAKWASAQGEPTDPWTYAAIELRDKLAALRTAGEET